MIKGLIMNTSGYKKFQRSLIYTTMSAVMAGGIVMPAASAEQERQVRELEEIVVSARRRDESLQEVPVAVQAFGSDQIEERGFSTEADLQMSTPGLMVRATNSSNQLSYSLRGQTIDAFSYSAPAVLAYVNEVQAGGVSASSFFDLESVQVLKGPQGTLFGRNATGGAVLYATKAPEEEFGGYIKTGIGSYSDRSIEGAINIPLTDSLFARVAGLSRSRDGWQKNLYNGDELGSIDTQNVRLSVLYQGDRLENSFVGYNATHKGRQEGLKAQYAYGGGDAPSVRPDNGAPLNTFTNDLYAPGNPLIDPAVNPRVIELGFDGIQDFFAKTQNMDFHDVYNSQSAINDIEQQLYSNTTSFEISDSMTLKNIIGYNKVESVQGTDLDGGPFMVLDNTNPAFGEDAYFYYTEQKSDELQVSGQTLGGDLDYIVGVFWSEETNRVQIPLFFFGDTVLGQYVGYDFETVDKSKAVFAQATYHLSDKLNVTAGYRHTWEEYSIDQFVGRHNWAGDANALTGVGPASVKFDEPSWNLTVDYQLNDEGMIYLSQRGSWRTGGFNGTAADTTGPTPKPDEFEPEKTWDVELGYKFSGYILDIPSQINLALYHQEVKDAQKTAYIGLSSLTGNVKRAKIDGLELDFKFSVNDWLTLGGAYAYTDARFTDPTADLAGFTGDFGKYGDSPDRSISLYASTEHELDGVGTLATRVDWYKVSDAYYTNTSESVNPDTTVPGYELLNLRVALNDINGSNLSIAGYVRNALDEEYIRGGLPLGGVIGVNSVILGEPRTAGLDLTYKF
jgi:iron complex outermembrane recepter protein